jgi:putative FmdB family regulatory protein
MPVYEYRCGSCEHRFEEIVSSSAPAPGCPACGSHRVERMLSSFVAGPARTPRADFSGVPFERSGCCGGACGHRH